MKKNLIYIPGSVGYDQDIEKWLRDYSEKNDFKLHLFYAWKNLGELMEMTIEQIQTKFQEFYLQFENPSTTYLIAKSFGGGVALLSGLKFEKMVLWAPVITIFEKGLPINDKLGNMKTFFDLSISPEKISSIDSNIFIIRGQADDLVYVKNVKQYLQFLKNSNSIEIENLGHSPKTEDDFSNLFAATFEFLKN